MHLTGGTRTDLFYFAFSHRLVLYLERCCLDTQMNYREPLFGMLQSRRNPKNAINDYCLGSKSACIQKEVWAGARICLLRQQKAWINATLFFLWLQLLDQNIGKEEGRKLVLLIDNHSGHSTADSHRPVWTVRVQFLPPSPTSRVQSLDTGIIAWVKDNYKHRLLFRVFDNIGMGKKSIYNVYIITEKLRTKEEWESCPPSVIKTSFCTVSNRLKIIRRRRGVIPIEKQSTLWCVMQPRMVSASPKLVWKRF